MGEMEAPAGQRGIPQAQRCAANREIQSSPQTWAWPSLFPLFGAACFEREAREAFHEQAQHLNTQFINQSVIGGELHKGPDLIRQKVTFRWFLWALGADQGHSPLC